jgi:(2R)-sulfolactate sulfo-lyase subunit alpha
LGRQDLPERPHFVVHNEGDTVGVVVVEDAKAGQELVGWVMENDQTIKVRAGADVPLGHKVAIRPMAKGDTVLKYEHDIGRALEDIPVCGYVHAHNVKTKRW